MADIRRLPLKTPPPPLHEFVFRLSWRATAKEIKMLARNLAEATRRVERMLMKEEGGMHCLEIKFLRQTK